MRLVLVLALLVCVAGLVLALQNPAATQVRFVVWRFESPLALVLMTAFAAGLLAGLLLMLPGRIRAGLAAASRKREADELARRLSDYETKLAQAESALGRPTPPSSPAPETSAPQR